VRRPHAPTSASTQNNLQAARLSTAASDSVSRVRAFARSVIPTYWRPDSNGLHGHHARAITARKATRLH